MKIALFYQSLISDWNHGNAHFLRGFATELVCRGHDVVVYEPKQSWCYDGMMAEEGRRAVEEFPARYPLLRAEKYSMGEVDSLLEGVSLAIVHEWSDPELISRVGCYRAKHPNLRAFFHDTHHRALSVPHEIERLDLRPYD